MVLGLRSKNRKAASVQVEYIIHLQRIKPWPPSQSLRSLRSVVLQWENGDKNSGFTNPVTPSLEEGKIEFNERFKLQVTLLKEASTKGNDSFQKNVLELNLYEPRRDKTMKGQHLGSAAVDLAEHGIVKETASVSLPVNCKRSFRNTVQPILYLKIQPFEKDSLSSSSRESLSKELSLDKDGRESVSALMSEEYAEEAEIASFTDDDISSHSSINISSSTIEANADVPIQNNSQEQEENKDSSKTAEKTLPNDGATVSSLESEPAQKDSEPLITDCAHSNDTVNQNERLLGSSLEDLSTEPESLENGSSLSSNPPQCSSIDLVNTDTGSSLSSSSMEEADIINHTQEVLQKDHVLEVVKEELLATTSEDNVVVSPINKENSTSEVINSVEAQDIDIQAEKRDLVPSAEPESIIMNIDGANQASSSHGANDISVLDAVEGKRVENDISVMDAVEGKQVETTSEEKTNEHFEDILPDNLSIVSLTNVEHTPDSRQLNTLQNDVAKISESETTPSIPRIVNERGYSTLRSNRLKSMKFSVRSPPDSQRSTVAANNDQHMEDVKEIDAQENVSQGGLNFDIDDGKVDKKSENGNSDKVDYNRNGASEDKVRELEHKVEMLERELRETAAIEISIYSVAAEHGGSPHKVHTPARRLSRLYVHASRKWSREKKANAAKCAVSGLVLAAKSCGNDVPRLTFWLSNSVMLRAIVIQEFGNQDLPSSANGSNTVPKKKSSPLRWESTSGKNEKFSVTEEVDEWEFPCTFTAALERIEAWIFSRIIESIWWQTLTPHMQLQSEGGKQNAGSNLKNYRKQSSLGDQQQSNISIEIWKKAFADAFERLCPVRAAGHDCGCLPMLARLVMEQCVARLDVAMFNAILRESEDEIPTDPVSDPISDSKVLPIPSGKSSFGAGAQLKNAIGNWSRWLTDLFGMDMDDSPDEENEQEDDRLDVATSLKSFHLLNALSDLLMLPKDMLLESSIRKEVCPTFSASMIKRILDTFKPDEFCPDPIPDMVFESLDSEDPLEISEEGIKSLPCDASPVRYTPPSVTLVQSIMGDPRTASLSRSGSSIVRKCHTSDDELDELESPLTSIIIDNYSNMNSKSKEHRGPNAVRYQLLHEVWRDAEY
ncbi:hypothetical protein J5N97_012476 [Dioscorea zingiberensis]|uniref:C2 NT-type domain-containing protein n=1 Tax=Dioscorea zingiberensis TaxID=325984 RepID=A0A9D5CPX6_9LILI|nr:hypothetical protein J5N97_012476 [Dioscorea zingiberensis]